MVRDSNYVLFQKDSIRKSMRIQFDGGVITNSEIHSEQFELTESLCSETNLRFGCCESSSVKFKISNVFQPLKDKWIGISVALEGNEEIPLPIGQYKVFSDMPTANRKYREIVAYDVMYDLLNADFASWYNYIFPNKETKITLKQFRDSFFSYNAITQEEITLPNDNVIIEKTLDTDELSGKTILNSLCEMNGCFGHIGRNGKFQYIFLTPILPGLYPKDTLFPSNNLFPAEEVGTERLNNNIYISAEYQDFVTEKINKIIIRQEENDIGYTYGDGENAYVIEDNFLLYGKGDEELLSISSKIYEKISRIWYRPVDVNAKGNPCFEVGDGIRLSTKYEILYSYILKRTLKGIQALKDTYSSNGEIRQSENLNSTAKSIIQLRGKTNTLIRTVEENRLEVVDIAAGLSSRITQNANQIDLRVTKDGVVSAINISPETITISANKINVDGLLATTQFQAQTARITDLEADHVSVSDFNAATARIGSIESDYVATSELNAVSARIGRLEADHVTVNDFNSVSGRVGTLEADHVTTAQLNAVDGKFQNLNASNITSGTLSVDRIDVASLATKSFIAAKVNIGNLNASQILDFMCYWGETPYGYVLMGSPDD